MIEKDDDMEGIISKVRKTIEQYHMLDSGDRIVIGVSGGADSVALFYSLLALREDYKLTLAVVHVNHMLRKEASTEEAYVKELCVCENVPYRCFAKDIAAYAGELRCSTEDAGRRYRYECFDKVNEELFGGCAKIAVAHHMNDRAETSLFHVVRGTGLKGLGGIPPVRDNVIRPLYQVTRKEIEEYLVNHRIQFYIDASNHSDDYARNRIRNRAIPALNSVNNHAIEHVAALSEQAMEYWNYVEQQAIQYEQEQQLDFGQNLYIAPLMEHPELLRKHIIYRHLVRISGKAKDWEDKHVRMVLELAGMDGGKKINLPYNIVVTNCYDRLVFCRNAAADASNPTDINISQIDASQKYICMETSPIRLESGKVVKLEGIGQIKTELRKFCIHTEISKKAYTKMIDYDTINDALYLRNPMPDDYMIINTQGGSKKLSRLFIDAKIPRQERSRVLVVAMGNQIVWIPGIRMSEAFKITDTTQMILQLAIELEDRNHT